MTELSSQLEALRSKFHKVRDYYSTISSQLEALRSKFHKVACALKTLCMSTSAAGGELELKPQLL